VKLVAEQSRMNASAALFAALAALIQLPTRLHADVLERGAVVSLKLGLAKMAAGRISGSWGSSVAYGAESATPRVR
jgi:hypothetical protein